MLSNIKILEFAGLASTVFTGILLSDYDYGAQIITISRIDGEGYNTPMNRGKKANIETIKLMIKNHDVLINPFSRGVLQRLSLSYENCQNLHPKLIYCSVTRFGQSSPLKTKAGHDINFISYAGVLGHCASTGSEKKDLLYLEMQLEILQQEDYLQLQVYQLHQYTLKMVVEDSKQIQE